MRENVEELMKLVGARAMARPAEPADPDNLLGSGLPASPGRIAGRSPRRAVAGGGDARRNGAHAPYRRNSGGANAAGEADADAPVEHDLHFTTIRR
jgi:hypothetical protein